jgi:hypothetical protein
MSKHSLTDSSFFFILSTFLMIIYFRCAFLSTLNLIQSLIPVPWPIDCLSALSFGELLTQIVAIR